MLLALTVVLSVHGLPSQGGSANGPPNPAAVTQAVDSSSYPVPANLSYCGLLGPSPWTAPTLPGYTANITVFWNDLCTEQAFISLIDEWGGPFYLAYPGYGANLSYWAAANLSAGSGGSTQGLYAYWFIAWYPSYCYNNPAYLGSLPPCSWEEYWSGNVWTNVLSGPFFVNESCECGSKGPPPPPSPPSAGFPYGLVLGFSLAGAFALGVALRVRRLR